MKNSKAQAHKTNGKQLSKSYLGTVFCRKWWIKACFIAS